MDVVEEDIWGQTVCCGNSWREQPKENQQVKMIINALNYIYCKQQNIFSFLGVNLARMCSNITFCQETEEDAMSRSIAVRILPFELGEAANCFTLPFLLRRQQLWKHPHAYRLRRLQFVCTWTLTLEWLCGCMYHCCSVQGVNINHSAALLLNWLNSTASVFIPSKWQSSWKQPSMMIQQYVLINVRMTLSWALSTGFQPMFDKPSCHYRARPHQWDNFSGINNWNNSQFHFAVR